MTAITQAGFRAVLPFILLSMLGFTWQSASAATRIAVLSPEPGAYSEVFETIILGIKDIEGIEVISREIAANEDISHIQPWLNDNQVDAVIALGQQGYMLAKDLALRQPLIVGAALLTPNGVSGISLAADPLQFFKLLGTMTPPVKRVIVVYSEKNSGWLIPLAQQAANTYGIELLALKAVDSKDAIRHYHDILAQIRNPQDAIWLPLDNIAPDNTILPMVLEAAWNKHLVVFSNNPSHVKRGALFSLYPDHRAMGQRLAQMILPLAVAKKISTEVVPLNDLKIAVNLRTASHLGMRYSAAEQREFSLIFPSR